jgi:hypothetical protein
MIIGGLLAPEATLGTVTAMSTGLDIEKIYAYHQKVWRLFFSEGFGII